MKCTGVTMKVVLLVLVAGNSLPLGRAAAGSPAPGSDTGGHLGDVVRAVVGSGGPLPFVHGPGGPLPFVRGPGGPGPLLRGPGVAGPDLTLDPDFLPVAYERVERLQPPPAPQECAYSPESGKDGSLHLTLTSPNQGVAFQCPGEKDELSPEQNEQGGGVFRVGSDGSCDTSQVGHVVGIPAGLNTQRGRESKQVYYFSAAGWPLAEDKRFCFVCTAKEGPHIGKKCSIFVTIPKAQLTNVANCGALGESGVAVFKDDGSDLSATFTCPAGQSLIPSVDTQVAGTGTGCVWEVPVSQIVDGATLTESKTGTEVNGYKLSLKSLPAEPRLFCFSCADSMTEPSRGPRGPPCSIYLYAPAKKRTDDGKTDPQKPQEPKDGTEPGDGKDPKNGKIPDPIIDVVTPDKKKSPNSAGYSLAAGWSTSLALVSLFFGATGVGSLTK
ncbi:sag-related sequence srs17a [Cystoisospora suis]|uniref:Sag-related sequence srs17a n=1 Tax=Cystoisospora suis TaxID=483139 RepID=A0A2C6KN74_9APIC|nr:sag-related sequence srs17a [Cystoisospora suis]